MQTLTTRRSMISCLIVFLLTAGALAGLDRFGRQSRVFGPSEKLADRKGFGRLVEHPTEAYRVWKDAGYRGRTVVFVADRWESFDPGELIPQQMFRAYPLELYNTAKLLEDEHLTPVTFLYVASLNRIVRKIVAVVPAAEVERMRQLVPKVKDSKASSRGVFLSRQGFPRWYSTGANFSSPGEPVLLYVGASYFRGAEPEELYRQLAAAGLRTDCVVLSREAGKAGVGPTEVARLDRFARLVGITPPAAGPGAAAPAGGAQHPGGAS